MTTKECMYKIKSFNEFTPEEQDKIINKHRYILTDDLNLLDYDDTYYEELQKLGFMNPRIYYDLGYSQGSGACFECTEFDWELLLSDFNCKHKSWIISILNQYCIGYIRKNNFGWHYVHSNTRYFELSFESIYHYNRIEDILTDIEKHIELLRYRASNNLTTQLYNQIEYLESDDVIRECLLENQYLFNEHTYQIEG